jgi:hypothetical protein
VSTVRRVDCAGGGVARTGGRGTPERSRKGLWESLRYRSSSSTTSATCNLPLNAAKSCWRSSCGATGAPVRCWPPNRPVEDWDKLLGDAAAVSAMLRLPSPPQARFELRSQKGGAALGEPRSRCEIDRSNHGQNRIESQSQIRQAQVPPESQSNGRPIRSLNIQPHEFHDEWNYTIPPRNQKLKP